MSALKRGFGWLAVCGLGLALAACSREGAGVATSETQAAAAWRSFDNADGTVTAIPKPPERILSTSVAITGTLLAIDAPVAASASTSKNQFFAQWADVAGQRSVENVWPAGSVDLETAYAAKPDLIVVARTGNDSAMQQLAELRKIAPTIVLDYGDRTWQDLAVELGRATGHEAQAQARIAAFDRHVAEARAKIRVPEGKTNIISFNGPGMGNPIATRESAHGRLLGALGFDIEEPDPSWQTNSAGSRKDFVWAPYENLGRLSARTTFLLSVDDDGTRAFLADPVLANLPSVRARQVHGLGRNSFRIDYFSATEIVDGIVEKFAK
ncbi:Fe2+-enterobactin ABC transporter substrate-binding protein [Stenotrophomonas sp. MMGLT7]|uniref:Fe2+-enterobactin ABC transporter substrate-binding protein n=1 Tax=Stenotrophomonas sp. MMGLT7 TaxID=2901227 RepID=UPI001E3424C6|nr:Fe2+-enterobactin ABC transporter substrate-binding protein [Stenotrophomonas sp. MMGLT7]MCD7099197.1 Fe2+-enterobactin ABC transporter substrate-binding protein [Stenotrophomonas sp. MMGLT7]